MFITKWLTILVKKIYPIMGYSKPEIDSWFMREWE